MGNPSISLNAVPNEPSLSDLLNLLKKEIFFDLNCHHLATVQSFNSAKQTITATVNYTKTIFELNETTGAYEPIQVNYPLLVDVPVIIIGGGGVFFNFPISQGDQCLILFNDRNIDNWFQSGQAGPVANSRAHSFADGLALIGPNSLASTYSNYDGVRALISNGTVMVGINPQTGLVTIENQTEGTLGTILGNIISQLETLANSPSIPGVPINSGVATSLAIYATQLAGLLE